MLSEPHPLDPMSQNHVGPIVVLARASKTYRRGSEAVAALIDVTL